MSGAGTPALRSVPHGSPERFPGTIPEIHTDVVGRHDEFDEIRRLITSAGARLVTLVGTGGVGKTTLAATVARRLWADYDGGVLFVAVTIATDRAEAYTAIARAAGWDTTDEAATRTAVHQGLASGPTLLVLDNCEQLADFAGLLTDLLGACPDLVVTATSRRPAGIAAERLVAIEPLEVPAANGSVREIQQSDATTVLVNAARRRNPSFAVTHDNASAIAELCRRLDGLPLALELAAARLHLLPPQQLLDLLAHRFDVLKVDTADKADRHRRLWATIDWSYQMLDPLDQQRFRTLGVFVGGFTLDAAATVVGCSPIDMLDTLDRLVAEHLVQSAPEHAGSARFDLLESMREFGIAELSQLGELMPAREAHAEWARRLADRWGPGLIDGAEQDEAVAQLDAERPNVAAAVEHSLAVGAIERVLAIGVALWRYWWYGGLARAGREWLEQALERDPPPTAATAAAYVVTSDLAEVTGNLPRARQLIEPALEIYARLGLDDELAPAWNGLGFVERELGNLDRAHELHTLALDLSRRLGHRRVEASSLNGLGAVATRTGDNAAAIHFYSEALDVVRELGDRYASGLVAQNLATALHAAGDLDTALATLREVYRDSLELGDVQNMLVTVLNLAEVEIALGLLDDAERHLAESERTASEAGIAHFPAVVSHHRGLIAETRGQLGAAFELYVTGLRIALEVVRPLETVAFLERIGALAVELGDDHTAGVAFGIARVGRAETGTPPIAETAPAEQLLAARGGAVIEPPAAGPWPQPAADALGELAHAARSHAGVERTDATAGADPLEQLGLTKREAEVARLVVARRTDQEIADELYVALRTASTHVSAVLRKLGVTSRRDVATHLAELGITV